MNGIYFLHKDNIQYTWEHAGFSFLGNGDMHGVIGMNHLWSYG